MSDPHPASPTHHHRRAAPAQVPTAVVTVSDTRSVETDAGGVVTSMGYDIRGFKISMSDPDMGVWDYDHNVLGELIYQRDAKGQEVFLDHDTLGRPKSRDEAEGITEWTYDTAAKGIGKLQSISAPHDSYALSQSYDSLGRPNTTTTTIDGVRLFLEAKVLYGPGKAANAGGVAISSPETARTACATAGPGKRSTIDCG